MTHLHWQPLSNSFGAKKRRFIILAAKAVLWFKDDKAGETPLGALALRPDATVIVRKQTLTICSDGEILTLHGDREELGDWGRHVRAAVHGPVWPSSTSETAESIAAEPIQEAQAAEAAEAAGATARASEAEDVSRTFGSSRARIRQPLSLPAPCRR